MNKTEALEVLAALTPTEREILVLKSKGMTAKQIANLRGGNHKTVERHMQNIYPKLGVSSSEEAAVIAAKAGIV